MFTLFCPPNESPLVRWSSRVLATTGTLPVFLSAYRSSCPTRPAISCSSVIFPLNCWFWFWEGWLETTPRSASRTSRSACARICCGLAEWSLVGCGVSGGDGRRKLVAASGGLWRRTTHCAGRGGTRCDPRVLRKKCTKFEWGHGAAPPAGATRGPRGPTRPPSSTHRRHDPSTPSGTSARSGQPRWEAWCPRGNGSDFSERGDDKKRQDS